MSLRDSGRTMTVVNHCMEGRFKFGEGCRTTAAVLRSLLDTCDVFTGQACHVTKKHHLDLPESFKIIGDSQAFVAYDGERFKADEHVWSPQGKLDGEAWNCVVRLSCIEDPEVEFFVISWYVLDQSLNYSDPKRSAHLFKQLTQLVQLLGRELPVLVGGNFQLSSEEANYLVKRESHLSQGFENQEFLDTLKCFSYDGKSIRRRIRCCGFFMATHGLLSDPLTPSIETFLDGGGPIFPRSIRGNVVLNGAMDDLWRNPEDFFYWDPSCLRLKLDRISGVVKNISKIYDSFNSSSVSSGSMNDDKNVNNNNNNNNNDDNKDNTHNSNCNNNDRKNDDGGENNLDKNNNNNNNDTNSDGTYNKTNINNSSENNTTNNKTEKDYTKNENDKNYINNHNENNSNSINNANNNNNNNNLNNDNNNSNNNNNNLYNENNNSNNNNNNNLLNTNTSEYEFDESEVDDCSHLRRSDLGDNKEDKDNYDVEEAYGRYLNIVKDNKSDNTSGRDSLKQIEKLKELRGFVDSIEQKHDEEVLKPEMLKLKQEMVHPQQEMVNSLPEMVNLQPEKRSLKPEMEFLKVEDDMGKSLSTICEYDEHSMVSVESIPDCGGGQLNGDDDDYYSYHNNE